jgi:hypothetical protein
LRRQKALKFDHSSEALPYGRHPEKAGKHSVKTMRNRQEIPLEQTGQDQIFKDFIIISLTPIMTPASEAQL